MSPVRSVMVRGNEGFLHDQATKTVADENDGSGLLACVSSDCLLNQLRKPPAGVRGLARYHRKEQKTYYPPPESSQVSQQAPGMPE